MRIALATSSYAPHVGGVEEHVRNVARLLRDRGHDVVVWTVARDGRFEVVDVEGVEVWNLPAPLPARSLRSVAGLALRMPSALLRWRRAFRAHRPDVIHVHCFGPNGTYARLLSRRYRTPMVVTSHGETLADDDAVFTRSRFAAWSLRRSLAEAAAVTACSRVTLDDLSGRFGLPTGKGEVVVNGVDLAEPAGEPPATAAGRYVAAVGRVQRVKGFDLLIAAFALAGLPEDVRLVIGGDGPELAALRAQSERLGVADRVILPGRLDRASVGGLLREATVGVVPSRFEAFGIAVLEVWRARTALIATTRGGPSEFVTDGHDGLLVDPEDTPALAAALARLVSDPTLAGGIASEGARTVTGFAWDRPVGAYESIYRRVTARP